MIRNIAIAVAVLIGGFLLYVSLSPSHFVISRERVLKASPETIFVYINSSKKMDEWMPWKESDPTVKMQYSGPDEGVGATSSWDSKGRMGTGKAEIIETVPNKSVKTQLTYTKPMKMAQVSDITLEPTSEGTKVTWSVSGDNSFMCKVMCVFINMDKEVGSAFAKGLENLDSITSKK